MAKLTLSTVTSRYGGVTLMNANFDAVVAAMENTLSLDGTSPNAMAADFDLGGYDVLNGGAASFSSLTVGGAPVGGSGPECIAIAASDETTALTEGTGKVTFRAPYALDLTSVRVSLTTAQTSGDIFTVDINVNGTTILSTKLTIDNGEKTSYTAATAAVLSTTSLAIDDEITVDIDQVGASADAAGLKVYLIGTTP